ncbi:hypothetical protein [Parasediminibacterium sp. JCM 36343]
MAAIQKKAAPTPSIVKKPIIKKAKPEPGRLEALKIAAAIAKKHDYRYG